MLQTLLQTTGFQLDLNLVRTFCPNSLNIDRYLEIFKNIFSDTHFYHHKRILPSALFILKPAVGFLFNDETGAC